MSRRPLASAESRLALAYERDVPGATMWSESPVTDVWSRVGSLGEDPRPVLPFLTFRVMLATDFEETFEGGYWQLHLWKERTGWTANWYSERVPFVGSVPAEEWLPMEFVFAGGEYDEYLYEIGPGGYLDPGWRYAELRWHYGDGSMVPVHRYAEFGPGGGVWEYAMVPNWVPAYGQWLEHIPT